MARGPSLWRGRLPRPQLPSGLRPHLPRPTTTTSQWVGARDCWAAASRHQRWHLRRPAVASKTAVRTSALTSKPAATSAASRAALGVSERARQRTHRRRLRLRRARRARQPLPLPARRSIRLRMYGHPARPPQPRPPSGSASAPRRRRWGRKGRAPPRPLSSRPHPCPRLRRRLSSRPRLRTCTLRARPLRPPRPHPRQDPSRRAPTSSAQVLSSANR